MALFSSGWLKGLNLNQADSEYCLLKAKCTHTMEISDTTHTAWISQKNRKDCDCLLRLCCRASNIFLLKL